MASKAVVAGRLMAALGVVAATVSAPVSSVHAATDLTASPTLLQSNWYWHHATTDSPVLIPGEVPSEPSNVPDSDLPVASLDGKGGRSKVSVVAFVLPSTGVGTTVSTFTATLTIDAAATKLQTEAPKLAAGLCLRNWSNGTGGEQDSVNAPPIDEAGLVPGVWSADGTSITFTAPAIAQAWFDDTNFGLEIVPAKDYTTPFQVSFLGGKDVKSAMTYSPPVAETPEPPDTTVIDPGVTGGTTPPPRAGSGPVDSGFTGGPPVTTGPPPAVDTGQVNPPSTTIVPAASALPKVSNRPSAGLFWAGVGIVVLLVVLSLVLGGQPQSAATARASRLTTVLRNRRPGATSYSLPA